MPFISSDGKENAWEVLACKCVARWCCVLSFLDFGRCYYRRSTFTWVLLQTERKHQWHAQRCQKAGTGNSPGKIWVVALYNQFLHLLDRWWTNLSYQLPHVHSRSFTLEFVSLHTKNYGWRIKATQHIEQKYSFKSFFVPFTLLLAAWCFLVHSWYQKQQHNFPYAYFLMCI